MEALEGRKGIGRKTIKPDRPATAVNIKTIQQAMNPEAGGGLKAEVSIVWNDLRIS